MARAAKKSAVTPPESLPEWAVMLREGRARLGLSQEAAGERVGRSQQVVADWESGKRQPRPYHRPTRYAPLFAVDITALGGSIPPSTNGRTPDA